MEYTTAEFSLEIDGLKSKLKASNFKGSEGLSQLFGFQIYLLAEGDDIKAEKMTGKSAVLTIVNGPETRHICGILSRFWWIAEASGHNIFYADLVPVFWLLTQRFDCRIFQDMTVPEIVVEVCKKAGITADSLDTSLLRGTYPERKYCVQYRESDYNFIARLLEEEGIYFFFEHQNKTKRHTLILVDAPSCHKAIEGKEDVLFHEPTQKVETEEHVYEYHYGHQTRPNTVTLRDYDFKRPDLQMQGNAHSNDKVNLEIYDYPGLFGTPSEGDRIAKARLEEMQAQTAFGSGRSNCCRFNPGCLFKLKEHNRKEFNKEYLLLHVQHSGTREKIPDDPKITGPGDMITNLLKTIGADKLGPVSADKILPGLLTKTGVPSQIPMLPAGPLGMLSMFDIFNNLKDIFDTLFGNPNTRKIYSNEFTCIPSQTPYRAPRVTHRPAVLGPHTAKVVGPKDEKCYMDDFGRVKVTFHWDHSENDDDKRTCWLRVASPYAGSDHGIQFHPLVGDEVVVTFLEGDPDRPLVTGVVYNGSNRPPLQPENRIENIILTPYQHRLMFSDREKSITLNTGGKDEKGETIHLSDEDSNFGNTILLQTADHHTLRLFKSTDLTGIQIKTKQGHRLEFIDNHVSTVRLQDKTEQLSILLNSDEQTITVENKSDQKILIDCQLGQVTVTGGTVNAIGGQVNITGSMGVDIKSDAKISLQAPMIEAQGTASITLSAPMIKLDSPMVMASGMVQIGSALQVPSVIATSYTPGAGNIW